MAADAISATMCKRIWHNVYMDNGKIKIYLRDGIPVVEIYHDGEIELSDVIWAHHTIQNSFNPPIQMPTNIIIDRVGSYCLSPDAYISITELMQESNRVAFVIHHKPQETIVDLAANTYLNGHDVNKYNSLEEAYNWLSA